MVSCRRLSLFSHKIADKSHQNSSKFETAATNRIQIAMKSQLVYTGDLESRDKSPLYRRDKSHQVACVNGPSDLPQVVFFERRSRDNERRNQNQRKGKIISERAFRKSKVPDPINILYFSRQLKLARPLA